MKPIRLVGSPGPDIDLQAPTSGEMDEEEAAGLHPPDSSDSFERPCTTSSNELKFINSLWPTCDSLNPASDEPFSMAEVPVELVKVADLMKHVRELAGDDYEGRESPSAGLDRAARYITAHVSDLGLKGANPSNSDPYRQPFTIVQQQPLRTWCDAEVAYFKSHPPKKGIVSNVAAVLEGSDPQLKDEAVLISAHYDHLGTLMSDHCPGDDRIFNGADDNASGVAVLLTLAKVLAEMKRNGNGPKRSILFLWTAAEELMMVGANHYYHDPLWPIKKTSAAINLDSVALLSADNVSVIDSDENGKDNFFHSMVDGAGTLVGFKSVRRDIDIQYYYMLDSHVWNSMNIPTLSVHEGLTPDRRLNPTMHTPKDDYDNIIKENGGKKLERVAQFTLLLLLEAANR